jgi:lipoate-protein ligase A
MPAIATPLPRVATRRARTHELEWRLIRDEPCVGATNMARDHALAACLRPTEGVVRLYGWSRPTVSFGKNEPAQRVKAAELDYVRRPTGGRAVLHDDELTYAVVAPLDAFGGLREAYLRINEALAEAIRALGAVVDVSAATGTLGLDAGPCFRAPARGELVAGGRKVVGSAQARLEGALLQHGSILLGGDQGAVGGEGTDITLSELLGAVDPEAVAEVTANALRRNFGGAWAEGEYDPGELETAARLEVERYGRGEWTWRR